MEKTKTVHLDDLVHEKLRELAFHNRTSIQQEVNDLLKKHFKIKD